MTSLVLAASLFYSMEILLYIIFGFILIRQKQPAMAGGLFGLSPRWRYYFIRLIRRFQILVRILDPGPYMEQSLNGGACFFYGISPFLQGLLLHEERGILNFLLPHPGDISILD